MGCRHNFSNIIGKIGDEVSQAVLNCLNLGSFPSSINHTYITLIPKVKSPTKVSKYRPISLCNILYKLVSKVVANRLKNVLPHLISKSQSAFQSDKAITDKFWSIQKSKKMGFMLLKLDMSKAYNQVEWIILQRTTEKMGFCEK